MTNNSLKLQAAFTMGYIASSAPGYPVEQQLILTARSMAGSCPNANQSSILEAIQAVLTEISIPTGMITH
jgi:hypothetical protein